MALALAFGKTVAQNFALLAHQAALDRSKALPLLAGWSRKSSLGQLTNLPVDCAWCPAWPLQSLAVERGARIVRVHDVAEYCSSALAVWQAMHDFKRITFLIPLLFPPNSPLYGTSIFLY